MILTSFSDGNFIMSRVFAYCRVSTLGQNTENQRREIEAVGFAITNPKDLLRSTSVAPLLPVSGRD